MSVDQIPGTEGLLLPAMTDDGRVEMLPQPQRVDLPWANYWSDFGDNLSAVSPDTGVGTGPELLVEASDPGDVEMEWQYNAPVQAEGGRAFLMTTYDPRDLVVVDLYAPSNAPSVGGALNCVLSEVAPGSGMNIIVPTPDGAGSHDIDITSKIGTSNVTVAVPVHASDEDGFYNYDIETGLVTQSYEMDGATPVGTGNANLFDFPITLTRYLNRVRVRGDDKHPENFPGSKARLIYPQWKWKVTLTQGGDASRTVRIVFRMLLFREKSY